MSEYQYYEFVAVDRPLTDPELKQVRALSTRARITATGFVNEYHWGDFKGDPRQLVERVYDAHLYYANWGSRRLMLRLPRTALDLDVAERYCVGDYATAWTVGKHLVLDFASEDETGEFDLDQEILLSSLLGVRTELATGDHRPLYLAWLAGYGTWERDESAFDQDCDDDVEPPIPAGLTTLTAAQQALAEFLRVDPDLLAEAASTSPARRPPEQNPRAFATWIDELPNTEKNQLLMRVAGDEAAVVHAELLRGFGQTDSAQPVASPRSVGALLDATARRRNERQRHEEAARARQRARRDEDRARMRQRHLTELAADERSAWQRAETAIDTKRPGEYDAAVVILIDLKEIAEQQGRSKDFDHFLTQLCDRHARKSALLARLRKADLGFSGATR